MSRKLLLVGSLRRSAAAAVLLAAAVVAAATACANTYTWDASGNGSALDGNGTWSTTNSNWWNGASDGAWTTGGTDTAVFGAGQPGPYTVAVSGLAGAGGITFGPGGAYAIGGGTINLSGTATQIAVNAPSATVGSVLSGGGLMKSGTGLLTLGALQAYSGATIVAGGTLQPAGGYQPPSGTVAFYQFNNSANLGLDSNGDGNNLLAGGGTPAYSSGGIFGGALYLDGASAMSLSGSAFLAGGPTGNSTYTIACWEKVAADCPSNGSFVGWGSTAGNGQSNGFRLAGANGLANISTGGIGYDTTVTGLSTNPLDGNWHFVAVTYSGSSGRTRTMYLDGSQISQATMRTLSVSGTNFTVGYEPGAADFKGWLDDMLVANIAYSPAQLAGLMTESGGFNLLPSTTTLSIAAGATLDLAGASQQAAALGDYGGGGGSLINSSTTASTLSLGLDGGSATFSGTIAGGGTLGTINLAASGSGLQVLAGNNTYSGSTTISGGTLQIGNGGGSGALAGSGAVSLANGAALVFSRSGTVTQGGAVTGAGGLTQLGPGMLVLTASNGYAGATTISGGTLSVGNGGSGASIAASSGVVLSNGATILFNHSDPVAWSNVISGTGGLAKSGSGTLTVTVAQSYTGAIVINGGTLKLNARTPVPVTQGLLIDLDASRGVISSNGVVSAWDDQSGNGYNATTSGNPIGFSAPTFGGSGAGTSVLFNSPQALTAPLLSGSLVGGFTLFVVGQKTGAANSREALVSRSYPGYGGGAPWDMYNSNVYFQGNAQWYTTAGVDVRGLTSRSVFAMASNRSNLMEYINGMQQLNTGASFYTDSGTNLYLGTGSNGGSAFTGNMEEVLLYSSTLSATDFSAVENYLEQKWITGSPTGNNPLPVATPVSIGAGGVLDLAGNNQQVASLADGVGGGGSVVSSNTAASTILTVSPSGGSTSTFSGGILGGGTLGIVNLVISGSGTQVLSGTNTYTGKTTVNGGRLVASGAILGGAVATVSAGTLEVDGALKASVLNVTLNANGTGQGAGQLAGSGTIALTGDNLYYDSSVTSNFPGTIASTSHDAGLEIVGGTLILSGSNSYLGGTTIDAGTLIATGEAAIPDGSSLSVGDASAFAGPVVPASQISSGAFTPVPEPGTLALYLAGAVLAAGVRGTRAAGRRKRRQSSGQKLKQ